MNRLGFSAAILLAAPIVCFGQKSGDSGSAVEEGNGRLQVPLGDGDSRGVTELHEVARNGSVERAKRLVRHGVMVNSRVAIRGVLDPWYDFVDATPLDLATAFGHRELANFLRNHGGRTATEIEVKRLQRISWGKSRNGLQLGVRVAIEKNGSARWPTYLEAYVRNMDTRSRRFLTTVHTASTGHPGKTSLPVSRLTLYRLGGGDLITLRYDGTNHLLSHNRNQAGQGGGTAALGLKGQSYTMAELTNVEARKRSLTLGPGDQIGPFVVRYADSSRWTPPSGKPCPDGRAQYVVVAALDLEHPQSVTQTTLEATVEPRLRFEPTFQR